MRFFFFAFALLSASAALANSPWEHIGSKVRSKTQVTAAKVSAPGISANARGNSDVSPTLIQVAAANCDDYHQAEQAFKDMNRKAGALSMTDFPAWQKMEELVAEASDKVLSEFEKNPECDPTKSVQLLQRNAQSAKPPNMACTLVPMYMNNDAISKEAQQFYGNLCSSNPDRELCEVAFRLVNVPGGPRYVCGQKVPPSEFVVKNTEPTPHDQLKAKGNKACGLLPIYAPYPKAISAEELQGYARDCSQYGDTERCLSATRLISKDFRPRELKCSQKK